MRGCAPDDIDSNDGVDASIRVCDSELCNDLSIVECKDCECFDTESGSPNLSGRAHLCIGVFALTVQWIL